MGVEQRRKHDAVVHVYMKSASLSAIREVEPHDAVVRCEEPRHPGEVRGAAGQGLHVHAPVPRVQPERLQCPAPAQRLQLVHVHRASIIPARTQGNRDL